MIYGPKLAGSSSLTTESESGGKRELRCQKLGLQI